MNYKLVFLLLVALAVSGAVDAKKKPKAAKPKNILLILADDLGWSDVGYADSQVLTPNIDELARTGVILNQTYAYALCTPSRGSILSGVYAEKLGLQHSVILPEQPIGLPTSFSLMPEILKQFGYKSHMVGKWHLGFCSKMYTPVDRGFDSFYGYFNAQEDYYTHRLSANIVFGTSDGLDYWNQTKDYLEPILDKNDTYSMFTFTDRAIDILEKHDKDEPLFMYFSSQNVHVPINVPEKYENMYPNVTNQGRRTLLGMVSLMDEAIGNITRKLQELDMLNDTIIFFTSDNGGATYASGRNFPLRGGKMTAFEGGHRTRSFINNYPNLKPYVNEGMFHAVDWLPTILNAALGVPVEITGIDGINQWPSISQNLPSKRSSFIYNIDPFGQIGCNYKPTEAIRDGDWKLIKGCPGIYDDWYPLPQLDKYFIDTYFERFSPYRSSQNRKKSNKYSAKATDETYLFNIKDDPLEKNNLAQKYPDMVNQLETKLEEYKKASAFPQNPPTLFPDNNADPAKWGDKWSPGWC